MPSQFRNSQIRRRALLSRVWRGVGRYKTHEHVPAQLPPRVARSFLSPPLVSPLNFGTMKSVALVLAATAVASTSAASCFPNSTHGWYARCMHAVVVLGCPWCHISERRRALRPRPMPRSPAHAPRFRTCRCRTPNARQPHQSRFSPAHDHFTASTQP